MAKENRFLIICTGYNCEKYVKPCYHSVINQTFINWQLIMISDGSTDGTKEELCWDMPVVEIHTTNEGAAKRRYDAIHKYGKEDDIIVLLDMDDELLPDALEIINEEYRKGKWMTYGNWVDQWGLLNPVELHYHFEIQKKSEYRKDKWRATACKTFRKFLFDEIPKEDFMLDGEWLKTATESELMFSCLEMSGRGKIGVIEKPIYKYNRLLPNGTQKRLGQQYKNDVFKRICERTPKNSLGNYYDT